MKLSIVTINYNDAIGLERTIQSVITQTFKDFEYIIIDGNSTDGSKEIIKKYSEKIQVAISEPDTGIYNAMNKGAALAKGEYLLFLNSGDNLKYENSLEELFNLDPKDDIVSSICIDYTETKEYLKIPPKEISLYTFISGSLPHPSTIIKNSVFKQIGGYIEDYKIISDWCFFIDALLIHRVSYSFTNVQLSEFNCYGISSTNLCSEAKEGIDFLNNRFGPILKDYLPSTYESMPNVTYWIFNLSPKIRTIMLFPFRVINRAFKLRNKLGKKIGVEQKSRKR